MKRRQPPQEIKMRFTPQNDVIIVVAGANRAAHNKQQHLFQPIHHLAALARIFDLGKMIQKALAPKWLEFFHGFLPNEKTP